jgi:transcriptional regulator with XRE-family HTH domain
MRTSTRKTTIAVLREILGIKDFEMAEILKRTVHTIHSLESGRLKLSPELATKMFHETGISLDWLLDEEPNAPPISGRGEPYTKEIFEKAQAEKIYYDQPNPVFRNTYALGFCARLIAILESASSHKNYHMALYKVHSALDSLQGEFGMDENLYQYTGPNHVNNGMAVPLLKGILAREKQLEDRSKRVQRLAAAKPEKKPLSKKKRRR